MRLTALKLARHLVYDPLLESYYTFIQPGVPTVAKNSHAGSARPDDRLMSHTFRSRSALSLAVAVALGLPTVVQAQTAPAAAPAQELEEVVVTGIRAGITDAIQVKADMQSIVETISAEDIGKLPDTSIADSIARLPGVTTQRAEGRASLISIRGTDPGFAVGLMNGREQVTTGDNRAIEYDQYPSELINAVVVYKTPDSQLFAQGLSGTIDLQTIRPLDYGKQALVLNARYEQNSQGDLGANSNDTGYRASFSYIDQFMDGTLGVAVGFARLDSPLATQAFGTYEPWHAKGVQDPNRSPGVPADAYITDGMKVRTDMGKNTRDGYLATIEFRPSESFGSILDLYYTDASQLNNARSLEVNLSGYPAPCCDGPFPPNTIFGYSNPVIRSNTVVGGDLNTVVPLARNFKFTTDDTIFAGGWLNEFRLNDEWQLRAGSWLFEGDPGPGAVRDERAVRAADGQQPDSAQRLRQRHVQPAIGQDGAAHVRARLRRSDERAGGPDHLRCGLREEAAH